jgi:translation initiation factor 5A
MVLKIINATDAKIGVNIFIDGEPCTVKKMDVSKTGKHGHAKARIEASGLVSGNKKVVVVPGHERFDVPLVEKKKGQVLSIIEKKASVMDLENFETIEMEITPEVGDLQENDNVEYWDIEGTKLIKRKL